MKFHYTTFDCLVNDPLNNSYEMILQYCLSVYAVNLFSAPHFTTFKIRIINQQSGDCNDSKILNANNLNSNAFPVLIKVKGGQRLLIKVKLIGFTSTSAEKDIGQGVSSFDKNSIDNSLRVPIYDKTRGVEQVAICSLDMFLSGFQLQKNVSGIADKSKSKIEDWRDRSEDVAFSQMSYTVESENEEREFQNENQLSQTRQAQSGKKFTSSELESFQGNRREFHKQQSQKRREQHKKVKQKGPNFNQRANNPLHNDSDIQDTQQNRKLQLSRQSQSLKPRKKQQFQALNPQGINQNPLDSSEEKQKLDINESINPDSIRERLKENEDLMSKLRTYLAKSMEKQVRTIDFRPSNHKIRRRKVKIQELSSYVSSRPHVKYHVEVNEKRCKVISQFKAFKHSKVELKDKSQTFQSIPLEKVVIYSSQNEKLVSFDALSYHSSCIINEVQNTSPKINIPDNQTSLKVKATLDNYGDFEGVLGVQEGDNMTIQLLPCQKTNDKYKSILSRECFKFSFSISKKALIAPLKEEMGQQEVSLHEPEQVFEKEDIRSRIKSLSMQPWGYGYSHLQKLASKLPYDNKQKKKSVSLKKQFKNQSSKQQTPIKYQDEEQLSLQQQKMGFNRFQASQFPESDSINKSISISSSIKQTAKKSSPSRKDICLLRNGNRNNFKLKDRRGSRQKQLNIKEMWQKLLIRKKIEEEEETEKQDIKNTRKQLDTVISFKKKTKPQKRVKAREDQTPNNQLYGCAAGSKEVVKVSENWPGQLLGGETDPFPLRSVTVEIKNISITQPQIVIDQDEVKSLGKFVKLTMKGKVTYFTQIIFNGAFNSILWKLSGCLFKDLLGNEKLTLQIYQTLQNKIDLIGIASIRTSKLYFLRNNHIYNGKILLDDMLNGEFTLGFEIQQHRPFEVIREEEGEESRLQHSPSPFLQTKVARTKTKMFLRGGPEDVEGSAQRQALRKSRRERGLSGTLKKERRGQEQLQRSQVLPGGIQVNQQ